MSAMMPDLSRRDELCCPDCGKPLVITPLTETRARFDGCGRGCRESWDIPHGSIMFGVQGGLMFCYGPPKQS
jgi:hypothetical protein